MDYYNRRKHRALERLLEAENDFALDISKKRALALAGIVCGLACEFVTGKLYRAFCRIVELASANSGTDPAFIELAILLVAGLFIVAFLLRRRCVRLQQDFEEYMDNDAVSISLEDFFASAALDDDLPF